MENVEIHISISSDASSLDVMAKLEISKYEPNLKLHKMPKYVALFARIELVPLSSLAGTGVSSTQLYTSLRKSFFIGHLLHLLVKIIRGLSIKVQQGEDMTGLSVNAEGRALFIKL